MFGKKKNAKALFEMVHKFYKNKISGKKKKNAKALFETACKVYNYRRDVIAKKDAEQLGEMIRKLDEMILDGKVGSAEYEELAKGLEKLMRKCGGRVYPQSSWTENVDTIIVVGIVALGIRSFFLQPFKIPTNSMYPSFYGMTSVVYGNDVPSPNLPEKIWRFVTLAANNYSLTAPISGELFVEVNGTSVMYGKPLLASEVRPVRKYFVWPTYERFYTFFVNGKKAELALPVDFDFAKVMSDAFDIEKAPIVNKNGIWLKRLGKVEKGEKYLNFDILGGDMLFVDRFTYNFKKPKVGDSIVFLTKYCDGITAQNHGVPADKYYIKRLVGVGGDTLKVEGDTLVRNGKPIEGSPAFAKNAKREGLYRGYQAIEALAVGKEVKVENGKYYAMGDNSYASSDSRYWGQVPEKAIVGKSLIIFYPFTSRWGATK